MSLSGIIAQNGRINEPDEGSFPRPYKHPPSLPLHRNNKKICIFETTLQVSKAGPGNFFKVCHIQCTPKKVRRFQEIEENLGKAAWRPAAVFLWERLGFASVYCSCTAQMSASPPERAAKVGSVELCIGHTPNCTEAWGSTTESTTTALNATDKKSR